MITVLSFSEAGGHPHNEDAFLAVRHPQDPEVWLLALADGQGGQAGGGRAARVACEAAIAAAEECPCPGILHPGAWPDLLRRADEAVVENPQGGFTTLIGLCVGKGVVAGASSGDSAALVVQGSGEVKDLTARQHKNPPAGSGSALFVPFGGDLMPPWRLLVLSDGVWKYAGWTRIIEAARTRAGEELLQALQALARMPGSGRFMDDFTLVLAEGTG